jgi:phosphate transport system substrate-binding protein
MKQAATRTPGTPHTRRTRRWAAWASVAFAPLLITLVVAPGVASAGPATSLIQGSGSSWAANAVNQWVADVNSQGVQVVYTPDGDAQGRQDFANRTSDFAVTAEGFQGGQDTSQGRPYAYLPIAAGGTSFPYQIRVDGQQVENLRLSGQTLVKIFTNQITNWDDPAITADNNGVRLPSLPIVPVVQAEGSGSTFQLTNYFATDYASLWTPFAGAPGPTEYYPRQGSQIAQNGSNAVMNYVSSAQANGAIGYVEYSFPLSVNYPVVKLLNSNGYYTLPTQYNVAVSLEAAQINMDKSSPNYLLQNLTNVYTNTDPRTYPLSSYVYMIEPTGTYPNPESKETTSKRQALADFEYYGICQGQKEIGPIGYSPLPVNLVEAAFGQIQELQAADPGVDLQNLNILTCDNPTFVLGNPNANYLAQIAPLPPACDHVGAGPCAAGVTPNGIGATPETSGSYGGGATHAGGAASNTSTTAAGGAVAATAAAGSASAQASQAATAKALAALAKAAQNSVGPIKNASLPVAATQPIAPVVALVLLAVLILPVGIAFWRSRRKRGTGTGTEATP